MLIYNKIQIIETLYLHKTKKNFKKWSNVFRSPELDSSKFQKKRSLTTEIVYVCKYSC